LELERATNLETQGYGDTAAAGAGITKHSLSDADSNEGAPCHDATCIARHAHTRTFVVTARRQSIRCCFAQEHDSSLLLIHTNHYQPTSCTSCRKRW